MRTDRKIRSAVCTALPKLGWIASVPLAGGDLRVLHGSAVESAGDWLVEGVWDAPFESAAFHRSEAFFGSGLRIEGDSVFAAASTGMVDRLVYVVADGELTVSNSLVALLAATGARLAIGHDYRAECSASLKGLFGQPYALTTEGGPGDRVLQLFHGNLVVADGACTLQMRTREHGIATYDAYLQALRDTLRRVQDNAQDGGRRTTVAAYSTLSSGYDSVAVTCLARELGVRECFTTRPDRSTRGWVPLEDGAAIAEALGLQPHLLDPPTERTTALEQRFLAPTVWGSELIFHDMAAHIADSGRAAVVYTGYHGDKVWDLHTGGRYLQDDILRGDTSGLNLSEVRLASGFFNVPMPFLFARDIRSLVEIAGAAEMAPWRLGTDYDRPIPRRIGETAGVPRPLFGQSKRVVMSYYQHPFNPELRQRFFEWLEYRLGIGRAQVRASEWLDPVDWKLGQVLARFGRAAEASNPARVLKRRLLRGHDLRQLMFKWAANDLADQLQVAAGAQLRAHGMTSR